MSNEPDNNYDNEDNEDNEYLVEYGCPFENYAIELLAYGEIGNWPNIFPHKRLDKLKCITNNQNHIDCWEHYKDEFNRDNQIERINTFIFESLKSPNLVFLRYLNQIYPLIEYKNDIKNFKHYTVPVLRFFKTEIGIDI